MAMAPRTAMKFYFDVISPFAYVAWHRVRALAAEADFELCPVPVLFAALLNHHKGVGPAEVEAKRRYIAKQSARLAAESGLPFDVPPAHPFNPLGALRLVEATEPGRREALVTALFDMTWGSRAATGVEDTEALRALAARLGLDFEASTAPETKLRLRKNAEDAIEAHGLFGVPSVVVRGELFWGVDSLHHIKPFLAGRDPAAKDDDLLRKWAAIPASAHRRPASSR